MGDLSEHFDRSEFADKVSGSLPDGMPDPVLVAKLELFRAKIGGPIEVISGYRDVVHNVDVGGAEDSPIIVGGVVIRKDPDMHTLGKASDISGPWKTMEEAVQAAVEVGFTGVGDYKDGHLHVDVRDGELVRWSK